MKYILKEITPLGKNDLFIANYWPDNQMDFPLHFHEDYELNLTLNVRGKRILGNLVEDFTEKDLVITTPNVLHCYKRDDAFLNTRCEVVVIQFPKELPSWGIFDTDQLRDIRNMLCQPAPELQVLGRNRRGGTRTAPAPAHGRGVRGRTALSGHSSRTGLRRPHASRTDRCPKQRQLLPAQPPHQPDRTVRREKLQP